MRYRVRLGLLPGPTPRLPFLHSSSIPLGTGNNGGINNESLVRLYFLREENIPASLKGLFPRQSRCSTRLHQPLPSLCSPSSQLALVGLDLHGSSGQLPLPCSPAGGHGTSQASQVPPPLPPDWLRCHLAGAQLVQCCPTWLGSWEGDG